MMNLPESKGSSGLRLPEGHMAEVSKIAVDSRVGHTPLMPLVSPDRKCNVFFLSSVARSGDLRERAWGGGGLNRSGGGG